MNLKDYNIENIVFIQQRVRYLIGACKLYNTKDSIVYKSIYSIMNNIYTNFDKNIINQLNYNSNLSKLEHILNTYKTIPKNITLSNLKIYNIKHLTHKLYLIQKELIDICKRNGSNKMDTIFPLLFFTEINQIKFYTNNNIIISSYDKSIFLRIAIRAI